MSDDIMQAETAEPRRIIWEKWTDPFMAAVKEHRERGGWQDSYAHLERPGQVGVYQGPMLAGPAGFIPLNELNCPSRNFNLWVGHCSFVIDADVLERMKKVRGVEVIRTWTPYRFWLGVGRAFEENRVKAAVLAAASPPPPQKEKAGVQDADASLEAVKRTVAARYKHWAVCVMENGKLDIAGGDDREQVEGRVREWAGRAKRVVTSWDER